MELCRAQAARRRKGRRTARTRGQPGRPCRAVAAQRRRRADCILCNQLSRCGARAVQHRLPRQLARTCRRQQRCQDHHRPSRSGRAVGRNRSRADRACGADHKQGRRRSRRAEDRPLRRADGGARRPARTRPPDRPVGQPVGDLHLGHYRPVERRAVELSPHVQQCRPRELADGHRRGSLPGRRADLPHRRHGLAVRHARARRVDRTDGKFHHARLLAVRSFVAIDRRLFARRDGDVPDQGSACRRRSRSSPAPGVHGSLHR